MNYIYFYPEFERILVCILIIAGICMQCFAFIYKFNSGAKGFKYVCELSFEFSVILLQFIYGYIYSCIYYQTNISIYYPEQYLAVGYIASILFLIMFIATAVYLKQAHITLSICFALPLLPFANHLANGTFTVVLFTALIMFIIRSVHLILKVSKLKRNTITPLSVKESIEVPNGQTSINEILKVDTKISDSEYKAVTGKIVVKGEISVCVLYTDSDCCIQFMESEVPFTEIIDCDDAGDETICDIDYSISDVRYQIAEDNDGDNRIVDIDVTVTAQVKATENVAVDMICDCYEPFTKTQLLKEEVELEEVVSRPSSQNTIREMVEMGTGTPSVSGVITRPYITKAQIQRGKLLAEGKIEAYILYLTDSNESPVYSMKKELPFSYMLDCESTYSDLIPEIKAEVKHTAYNLNVAGEIEIRCILSLNANIIRKRKIELVNEVVTEPLENGDKNGIVIYFVQKGDNLWEIAKRYAVPQSEILRFNNMEKSDKLEIGNRLFIPSI